MYIRSMGSMPIRVLPTGAKGAPRPMVGDHTVWPLGRLVAWHAWKRNLKQVPIPFCGSEAIGDNGVFLSRLM